MIRLALRAAFSRVLGVLGRDFVTYQGQVLPPRRLRFCGQRFRDDEQFLSSARAEADRLASRCGLSVQSRVLDVGCGPGRLAIGILDRVGEVAAYEGIDVDAVSIAWCRRYLEFRHPAFRFTHIDLKNARYNPGGAEPGDEVRLPVAQEAFDIIYLYSVFSHLDLPDVRRYLKELARLLAPGGTLFLTGFFEQGAPEVTENPDEYRQPWKGPLHAVRYGREAFEELLAEVGWKVLGFEYGQETDGQSAYYLTRG
jgi:SAM-dependent methyltransferase